jgi:hypothetical protein
MREAVYNLGHPNRGSAVRVVTASFGVAVSAAPPLNLHELIAGLMRRFTGPSPGAAIAWLLEWRRVWVTMTSRVIHSRRQGLGVLWKSRRGIG